MGRWDSPSPVRARSRSPRDRKDDRYDRQGKRSRWENDDEDSKAPEKEEVRRRDDRERGGRDRRKYDDREREGHRNRRRDDDESGDARRGERRERERERDRDRDSGYSKRDRDRPRNRERRSRSRDRDRPPPRDKESKPKEPRRSRSRSQHGDEDGGEEPPKEKEQPNFGRTSHLVAETNTMNGVVLKYVEPPEARLPPSSITYRLYVFKASEIVDTIPLSTRTAWLIGRDRLVVDLPIDHPSASKQHAAIQFRFISKVNEWGEKEGKVKPYIIDLGSANGTKVNGKEIPRERYYELLEKDMVTFGHSTREYVLMIEK